MKSSLVTSPIRTTSRRPSSGCGLGRHPHPAGRVVAVHRHDLEHGARAALLADARAHLDRAPAGEHRERCHEERHAAAHRLRGRVGTPSDRAADAGAGEVGEVRLRPRAVWRRVAGAADVDRRGSGRRAPRVAPRPCETGSGRSVRSPCRSRAGSPRERCPKRAPSAAVRSRPRARFRRRRRRRACPRRRLQQTRRARRGGLGARSAALARPALRREPVPGARASAGRSSRSQPQG